jgi:hypothetical protein
MSDASYRAGALAVLSVAEEDAAAIRARPDAGGIRQKAAAEALEAFSAAVRLVAPEPRSAVSEALRATKGISGDKGEIPCPDCAGRLR